MFGFRYGWTQHLKTTIHQEAGLSYLLSPDCGVCWLRAQLRRHVPFPRPGWRGAVSPGSWAPVRSGPVLAASRPRGRRSCSQQS